MGGVGEWLVANWVHLVAAGWAIEKLLKIVDKLLPAHVTIDNDIADYLTRFLKVFSKRK